MKKYLQVGIISLLGLAIAYQAYIYFSPVVSKQPSIPNVPITLLDNTKTSIAEIGMSKHSVIFVVRSECDYCKKEIKEIRKHMDKFQNTELIFLSFEEIDVIRSFKYSILPESRPYITFAKVSREDIEPILEEELVFPYMIYYNEQGIQKAQHRGMFPVERIIQVTERS